MASDSSQVSRTVSINASAGVASDTFARTPGNDVDMTRFLLTRDNADRSMSTPSWRPDHYLHVFDAWAPRRGIGDVVNARLSELAME